MSSSRPNLIDEILLHNYHGGPVLPLASLFNYEPHGNQRQLHEPALGKALSGPLIPCSLVGSKPDRRFTTRIDIILLSTPLRELLFCTWNSLHTSNL
jgi:hypothetical protein